MSLKHEAKKGMIWTFAQQFGTQIVGFGISVILARLLLPEDFGIIALFGVIISIASTLVDGGMVSSLIRTENPTDKDFSTVFIFNVVVSLLMYFIVFYTAPFIAHFFSSAELIEIIRVYGMILVISALSMVQRTRLTKILDFKTQFKIQLPSLFLSGIIGIFLAYNSFGVWALVYSAISQASFSTLQFWIYSKWKPDFKFDITKFKYHFSFGYKMTLSGLLNVIFIEIYTILIGKLFSPIQLGYYNRADSLKQLPVHNISFALNKVTFPLFAKIAYDNVKLKEVYHKLMCVVIFVIAPVLMTMVVLAEPLIQFLFTEKWLPSVPFFQILSIAGLLYPIHAYNLNILQVKGRSDLFLKLEIFKKILIVLAILISLPFGIYALLWGQVITSFFAFFINTHFTGKFLMYSAWNQIMDVAPSIILSLFCGSVIYWLMISFCSKWNDFSLLVIMGGVFLTLYLGLSYLLKFKEITYIRNLLKQ